MIFDEELKDKKQLSLVFKDEENNINNNNSIESKQSTMLKIIFNLLKEELEKDDNKEVVKDDNKEVVMVKLFDGLRHTDEGYYLLSNLIEKMNFKKIAEKYYLYFFEGEYDHHETFYYEIVWDYDTYKKMNDSNNKSKKQEYIKTYKNRKKEYFNGKKY